MNARSAGLSAKLFLSVALIFASQAISATFSQNPRVDFSQVDLYPMLQFHNNQHAHYGSSLAPPDSDFVEDLFISRGGATVSVSVSRIEASPVELQTSVIRGVASKEALADLKKAIIETNAGVQKDCEFQSMTDGVYEITWYGKNGRRNQFAVHFGRDLSGALPTCPTAVDRLLEAIVRYANVIRASSANEVLQSK